MDFNVDRTQFVIAIVTNIISVILIWLAKRLTRGAKSLLTSGTMTAKVRAVLTVRRVSISVSVAATLLNLWVLSKFLAGRSSFTRLELFAAIALSLITFYWANQLVAGLRSTTERALREAQGKLVELEGRFEVAAREGEEAKRSLKELQERAGQRWLSTEQRRRLLKMLGESAKGSVYLQADPNPEINDFADHLVSLLTEAGWTLKGSEWSSAKWLFLHESWAIVAKDPYNPQRPALGLQQALEAVGYDFALLSLDEVWGKSVVVEQLKNAGDDAVILSVKGKP